MAPMSRNILRSSTFPLKTRTNVARMLLLSKLFHSTAAWASIANAYIKMLNNMLLSVLRSLAQDHVPKEKGYKFTYAQLITFVQIPPAERQLRTQRLRFVARLLQSAPDITVALLQANAKTQNSWMACLQEDLI